MNSRLKTFAGFNSIETYDPKSIAQYLNSLSKQLRFSSLVGIYNDVKYMQFVTRLKWDNDERLWKGSIHLSSRDRIATGQSREMVTFTPSEAQNSAKRMSHVTARTSSDILELGACLGIVPLKEHPELDQGEELFVSGAWLLSAIADFFPKSKEDIKEIVQSAVNEEFGITPKTQNLIVSHLHETGICDCLDSGMVEEVERLKKKPEMSIAPFQHR